MKRENKTNSEETKKVWKKPQLSKLEELNVEGGPNPNIYIENTYEGAS